MTYNEIQNILVDSVVLPYKPLSNIEIITMLLKSYQYMDLEYFLETLFLKKTKLNVCGILNLDSSSGDGMQWVMWFKQGKDKFYFDSYGGQPASELIAYLQLAAFYNSERSPYERRGALMQRSHPCTASHSKSPHT